MKTKKIFFVLSLVFTTFSFAQNWNAVCVGINDYPGTGNDLNWCVNDAQTLRQRLITYKEWGSSSITLLTDGAASETAILTTTNNMSKVAGSTNFFHYSGHGDSQELGGSN